MSQGNRRDSRDSPHGSSRGSSKKNQRRNNRKRRYGGKPKSTLQERHATEIKAMDEAALGRFKRVPPPMAFPLDLPDPKTFKFKCWTFVKFKFVKLKT